MQTANTIENALSQNVSRPGRERYQPKSVVAARIEPGQKLELSNTKTPDNRLLVLGQDFDWSMPKAGQGMAIFTALVPLLVAIHGPRFAGAAFAGGIALGHIRAARETRCLYDIVSEMDASRFCPDVGLWKACSETGKIEHLVTGGPKAAVIYEDELVVPAFHYKEGERTDFIFNYVVEEAEAALLGRQFVHGARQRAAAAAGAPVKMDARPNGVIRSKTFGNVGVDYDSVGRVFGLTKDGKGTMSVRFLNQVRIARGEVIQDPTLRALCELPPLEGNAPVTVPALQPAAPAVVEVKAAAAVPAAAVVEAKVAAPAAPEVEAPRERIAVAAPGGLGVSLPLPVAAPARREVPVAPRRAEAPKVGDLAAAAVAKAAARQAMLAVAPASYCGPLPPPWMAEAMAELTKLVGDKTATGDYSAEDGTVITMAGEPLDSDAIAGLVMYHDQLAFEGDDMETFYVVKETLANYAEVYGA